MTAAGRKELAALKAEVDELRAKVTELELQAAQDRAMGQVHHHYHYPPATLPQTIYPNVWPWPNYPQITYSGWTTNSGTFGTGAADALEGGV